MRQFTRSLFITSMGAVAVCSTALAQDAAVQESQTVVDQTAADEEGDAVQVGSTTVRFFGDAGALYQFETGIDGDKDMSVARLSAGFDVKTPLSEDWGVGFRINYGFDSYDFSGDFLGGTFTPDSEDPWGDIHTIEFGMVFEYDLNDQLEVLAGPVFKIARESGADWDDAMTGGGVFGAAYQFSSDLVLGGGLGIVSQIEDDLRVFPIIIIEWAFADDWRISTDSLEQANIANGVELVFTGMDDWQFAIGGGFRHARFLLDDSGLAPDGVGEDESLPVWLRTTWEATPNIRLSGLVGLMTGGELKLEDSDGDNIESVDYDSTWIMGIFGRISF